LPNLPQARQIVGPVRIEADPSSLDVTDAAFNEDWTNRRNTIVEPAYPSKFAETYARVDSVRDPRLDEVKQRSALEHTIRKNADADVVEQAKSVLESINEELQELKLTLQGSLVQVNQKDN
jgi:hypothetical protein